jgi:hypothetical protein
VFTLHHPRLARSDAEHVGAVVAGARDEPDVVKSEVEHEARYVALKRLPWAEQ